MTCVTAKEFEDMLRTIRKTADIDHNQDKDVRLKVWNISDESVRAMFNKFSADGIKDSDSEGEVMALKVKKKLEDALAGIHKDHYTSVQEFINNLAKDHNNPDKKVRHQAIALKEVIAQVQGEADKIIKANLDDESGMTNGYTPHVPLHRLAASVGRQIAYLEGYRFKSRSERLADSSVAVERGYYTVGIAAIENLAEKGYLNISEAKEGKRVIKDFLDDITDTDGNSKKNETTVNVPTVQLVLKKIGITTSEGGTDNPGIMYLNNKKADVDGTKFESYIKALDAISVVSKPQKIAKPHLSDPKGIRRSRDEYEPGERMEAVRRELESKPMYIDSELHEFFKMIEKVSKAKGISASKLLSDNFDNAMLQSLFQVDKNNSVISNDATAIGQNLSRTVPMDDLIAYYEHFTAEDGTAAGQHMTMFGGRNVRFYLENSIGNPQTSKLLRNAFAVKPYTMNVGSEDYLFFMKKVALRLGWKDNEDLRYLIDTDAVTAEGKRLHRALDGYDQFVNAKTFNDKIKGLKAAQKYFPTLDFAELTTVLKAANEIMTTADDKTITTTLMVGSDATAYGGQTTLKQAVGIGDRSEKVVQLLRQLSLMKSKTPVAADQKIDDIYGILKKRLENFVNRKPVDKNDPYLNMTDDEIRTQSIINLMVQELYSDKIRDLSKNPTMVAIYRQALGGAKKSIAESMLEELIKELNKSKVSEGVIDLINMLMPDQELKSDKKSIAEFKKNETTKKALFFALRDSGTPEFLYNEIQESILKEYLEDYIDRAEAVGAVVAKAGVTKMRMYPTSMIVEWALKGKKLPYTKTHLEKHGVTTSKIFAVGNEIGGDTVLTMEEKDQSTVLATSLIHGVEQSNIYYGAEGMPKKHDTGMFVIHDNIVSSAPAVREAEGQVIENDYLSSYHVDLHEEYLKAAAAYTPKGVDINSIPGYTELLKSIQEQKSDKQTILKENHDPSTRNIIGDENPPTSVSKPSSDTSTNQRPNRNRSGEREQSRSESTNSSEQETSQEKSKETSSGLKQDTYTLEILKGAAFASDIISDYLSSTNPSNLERSDLGSSFDPKTDTIAIDNNKIDSKTVERIEHEIVHSFTVAAIQDAGNDPQLKRNVAYLKKAIAKLSKLSKDGKLGNLDKDSKDRVDYVLSKKSEGEAVQIAEFLAVMASEREAANSIYSVLGDQRKKSTIQAIIYKIRTVAINLLSKVTDADLKSINVDIEKLHSAVQGVIETGKSRRETDIEAVKTLQKEFGTPLDFNDKVDVPYYPYVFTSPTGYINDSFVRHINDPLMNKGAGKAIELQTYLEQTFPVYKRGSDRLKGIYADSDALQELAHKIANAGTIDFLDKKNNMLSMMTALRTSKDGLVSDELQKYSALKLREDEKANFFEFTHKMAIQDYFLFAEGVSDMKNEIKEMEKEGGPFTKSERKAINSIVEFNVNDVMDKDTVYSAKEMAERGEKQELIRKLVVMKSIQAIGEDKFNLFKKNTALMTLVKDTSLANENLSKAGKMDNRNLRDHQLEDQYETNLTFRVIGSSEVSDYSYGKNGWKVLVPPKDGKLGVITKEIIDSTYQEGTAVDMRMHSGDINVDERYKNDPRVIKVGDTYKYILSPEKKMEAGLQKDASQTLVRAMGHSMYLTEGKVIQDLVMESTEYWDLKKKGFDGLETIIKDKDRDHPWMIGGDTNINYDDLPQTVKDKYKPKPKPLSDMGGTNSVDAKVQYVRKDIAYWFVGANEHSIAKDPKFQWAIRITKDLVSSTKIGQVITNPKKIFMDGVSNTWYLMARQVNPLFIQKQTREISREFDEFKKIQNRLSTLKVKGYARPDDKNLQKKIKLIEREMKSHPANGFVERGFINSLGSDIILNTNDPSSGYKNDLDTVLKYVFQDNKGKDNEVGKFIMSYAKWGYSLEDFLEILSPVFGSTDSLRTMETQLNVIGERLKKIKSEDDLISYLHQYLNSPDSEFVKLGTHMTDLVDLVAKETLYRHHISQGMDQREARLDVIDSFPDYKEGMPTRVKQLSDVGILMYPNYWLRIQKAIYRLAREQPVGLGIDMAIEHYFDFNHVGIMGQFLPLKFDSFGGIIHNPFSMMGVGTPFPTNITNFGQ